MESRCQQWISSRTRITSTKQYAGWWVFSILLNIFLVRTFTRMAFLFRVFFNGAWGVKETHRDPYHNMIVATFLFVILRVQCIALMHNSKTFFNALQCKDYNFTNETFLTVLKTSDCFDELNAIKEKVDVDITRQRSKDTGGDDGKLLRRSCQMTKNPKIFERCLYFEY